jgi:hypothetical protein
VVTETEVFTIHTVSFYEALKNRDLGALEKLYSDNYMLVRSNGSALTKQQVLTDLSDQGLTFHSIELLYGQVRLFGSTAILTGVSRTVSFRNGKENREYFRLIAVYVNENAAIRLAHFQSTTIADELDGFVTTHR